MKEKDFTIILAAILIVAAVCLRVVPHPANFAPMTAIALFGGAVLPRRWALVVPLLAMICSDAVIGFYAMMPVTWACYGLIAYASSRWMQKPKLTTGVVLTLASSTFFFVATNFAVWLTSGMYAHTWSGLSRCFTLALPFFRNTALSDIVYTAVLFGTFFLVQVIVRDHPKLVEHEV